MAVTVLDADGWYTVADDTPAADASTAVTATTVEPTVPSTASEVIQEVSPVQANENVQKQEDAPVETLSSDNAENDEAKLPNIDTTNTTITTTTTTTTITTSSTPTPTTPDPEITIASIETKFTPTPTPTSSSSRSTSSRHSSTLSISSQTSSQGDNDNDNDCESTISSSDSTHTSSSVPPPSPVRLRPTTKRPPQVPPLKTNSVEPRTLKGRVLSCMRRSAGHPAVTLTMEDGEEYQILVDGYDPKKQRSVDTIEAGKDDEGSVAASSSSRASEQDQNENSAQIQTQTRTTSEVVLEMDEVLSALLDQPGRHVVSAEIADCAYIQLADHAHNEIRGKYEQRHAALAIKFVGIKRWRCVWAMKVVKDKVVVVPNGDSKDAKDTVEKEAKVRAREFDDVYLAPLNRNSEKAAGKSPTRTQNPVHLQANPKRDASQSPSRPRNPKKPQNQQPPRTPKKNRNANSNNAQANSNNDSNVFGSGGENKFADEVKTHRRTPSRSPDPKFANGLVPLSQFSVSPTASPRKDKFKEKKVHYQLGQKGNVSKEDVREEINPPRKAKRNSVSGDTGVSVRSLRIALGSVL